MASKSLRRPGYTIIEIITVIFIVGILSGIVAEFLSFMNKKQADLQSQSIVQAETALAMDKTSKIIRSATNISIASDNTLEVLAYANVADTVPSKISVYLDGATIRMKSIAPSGNGPNYTYNSANAVITKLINNTFNGVGRPIFVYYNDSNAQLTQPVALGDIKMIGLNFIGKAQGLAFLPAREVSLSSKVQLRNFKTNF